MLKSINYRIGYLVLWVIIALTIGCGGTDHTTVEFHEGPEQCVPGHHEACWCETGVTGHQTCREDGMAYGHCECPEAPEADAGTTPEASTTEDTGTDPDADAEAEAEADARLNLLRVWMASEPTSSEVEPGSKNVPVLGLELQAYQTNGDVNVDAIGISCRASIGGETYEGTECWKRVDRVEIIDENGNQLAPADTPDLVAGIVYYAVQYTVEKGETRNLTVRASFSEETSASEPYDKVSFDLADLQQAETGIVTEDATVVVGHGFGLNQQGEEPKVEFTIVPNENEQPQGDAEYCQMITGMIMYGYSGCCGAFQQSNVTELKTGDLFKATDHYQVYYFGSDGLRYVFPTSVELDSWHAPLNANSVPMHDHHSVCNRVLEIPETEMANIHVGGNVTKRPGAFATGIYTDMQRYVVDHYHVLRPVSQPVLSQMYSGSIPEYTHLTPDYFFINYLMGSPITDPNEFDHLLKYNTAMIEVELGIKECYPGTYIHCTCSNGSQSQALCSVNYEPLTCQC